MSTLTSGQLLSFWQAVYIACIRAGKNTDAAAEMAHQAVCEMEKQEAHGYGHGV